jgi:hypothetical protein
MSFPKFDPEQLDDLADRLRSNGAQDSATFIALCADAWRREQALLHAAQADNTALQLRINEAQRSLRSVA